MRPSDWRIEVWRSFLRAHSQVVRRLERDLTAEAGLPLAWYDVLLQLAEAPDRRLRMAELADSVLLSRSGLTRLVDRLQAAGLVQRGADERNRSIVTVEATEAGRDLVTVVLSRRRSLLEAVLDRMEPVERAQAEAAAAAFVALAGDAVALGASGPVPL